MRRTPGQVSAADDQSLERDRSTMTVAKRTKRPRPSRLARVGVAMTAAVAIGAAAAWLPTIALAVGAATAAGTLLLAILIWTEGKDRG